MWLVAIPGGKVETSLKAAKDVEGSCRPDCLQEINCCHQSSLTPLCRPVLDPYQPTKGAGRVTKKLFKKASRP